MDGNNENFISIMAENDAVWRKEQNKRFINKLKERQTADYIEIPNRDHSSLISKILEKDDQVSKLHQFYIFHSDDVERRLSISGATNILNLNALNDSNEI